MLNKGKAKGALIRFRAWLGGQEVRLLWLYICLRLVDLFWISKLDSVPGAALAKSIFYFLENTILGVYLGSITGRRKYRWYSILALFIFATAILGVAGLVYGIGRGSSDLLAVAGAVFFLLVYGGVYALCRFVPPDTSKKKG